jgi:multidrug efflux pump subunit AcrA (membrane-fusion protein)
MAANVTIVTAQARNVPVVPNAAIQRTASGAFVNSLDLHNRLVRVPVRMGIHDAAYTQILAGLQPGQRILLPQPFPPAGTQ